MTATTALARMPVASPSPKIARNRIADMTLRRGGSTAVRRLFPGSKLRVRLPIGILPFQFQPSCLEQRNRHLCRKSQGRSVAEEAVRQARELPLTFGDRGRLAPH